MVKFITFLFLQVLINHEFNHTFDFYIYYNITNLTTNLNFININ